MNDIDWHKVHTARLAACCQRAAADLNLSITSPFILDKGTDIQCTFVAHFPDIGPHNGTVVCLAGDWEKLSERAAKLKREIKKKIAATVAPAA